jgi:hypothetical protein
LKPNSHKAFNVVLTVDDVFSESAAAGKDSGKQGVPYGASPSGLKRKEEAMTISQTIWGRNSYHPWIQGGKYRIWGGFWFWKKKVLS